MPTYHAVGITATLSVANLQASYSNVFDLRMFAEQRTDAERVESVFATGRNLPEKPIGPDGGETGVLQFVGEQRDLPLCVVEAGDGAVWGGLAGVKMEEEGTAGSCENGGPVQSLQGADTDSPLTSLGGTPSTGEATASLIKKEAPLPAAPTPSRRRAKKAQSTQQTPPLTSFSNFERARGFLDAPDGPQALCLTVQTSAKSLLPQVNSAKRSNGKDLKLEVFLNGELVANSFINTRGSAVELKDNRVRFHGTRVHRQSERPWTYNNAAGTDRDSGAATDRWQAASRALEAEADARGRNQWGDYSPSAELLLALSQLELPERLHDKQGLAVIDLVVTAGSGKKYSAAAGYVTAPTRMKDPGYKMSAFDDPFADEAMLLGKSGNGYELSPLRDMSFSLEPRTVPPSSLEVPLIRLRRSVTAVPQTPTKQLRTVAVPELDLNGVDLDMEVASYENSRGKTGQRRTLRRRLNDIKQMNPKNRAKHIAALREELDEDTLRAIKKEMISRNTDGTNTSPSKRARLDASCDFDFALNMLANAALAGDGTMDPMMLWRSAPAPFLALESKNAANAEAEEDAVDATLMQDRMDLALESGAGFHGPLLQHIVATSPQRTPQKKTRASALANSPCSVPVKESPKTRKNLLTPQERAGRDSQSAGIASLYYPRIGSPIPIHPILAGGSPSPPKTGSGRGANRTRTKWNPKEKTALEANRDFVVPEACQGSIVGYAADTEKVLRQIGKARNGEFREETVVVGMRFVVV